MYEENIKNTAWEKLLVLQRTMFSTKQIADYSQSTNPW